MSARILIIDDEANLRKTLAQIFSPRGYSVLEADDGASAVKILLDSTPDLIISDWKMPQMGGEELLQHLRGQPRLASIPVIVITAFGSTHSPLDSVRFCPHLFCPT